VNNSRGTIQPGLPVLACWAAAELDNLSRGRGRDLDAVEQLVDVLRPIQGASAAGMAPDDALVMHQAIVSARIAHEGVRTRDQLLEYAADIRQRLEDLVADPSSARRDADELGQLKVFCLELSKSAMRYRQLPEEVERTHPNRRSACMHFATH